MKKIIIVLAVCAVLGVGAFFVIPMLNNDVTPPGPDVNPVISGDEVSKTVKVEPVKINNHADHITIENVYPKITSFNNKEFENYINKSIATNISEYRNEINQIVDDITPVDKNYNYMTDYEQYLWGDYLTLVITHNYQTGGIRSNVWKEMYNINVSTERIIYLEELFRATVDYEEEIINEITSQAAAKNYVLMGGDGLHKLLPQQKFYIRDGRLVIYFDPSEVAANKYGALEFEMPFTLDAEGFFTVE